MDMENLVITCSVCQDSLADSARTVIASPVCGHVYHSECLANWFQSSARNLQQGRQANLDDLAGKCPACDSNFSLNFGIQLFLNVEEDLERTTQAEKLEAQLESTKEQNNFLTEENAFLKSKCISLEKALTKTSASATSRKLVSHPFVAVRNTATNPTESKASANVSRTSITRGSAIVGRKRVVNFSSTPTKRAADGVPPKKAGELRVSLVGAMGRIAKPASPLERKGILKKSAFSSKNTPTAGASASTGPKTRSQRSTEEPANKIPRRMSSRSHQILGN